MRRRGAIFGWAGFAASVFYVEKTDGSQPLSVFSDAATLPAHATALGKALLAFSPAETVDHVVRHGLRSYTSSTVTTARCVAAPHRGQSARVVPASTAR